MDTQISPPVLIEMNIDANNPSIIEVQIQPAGPAIELTVTETGPQGWSAYEIAVANGFIGNESDWLASLEGAPGAPGTTDHSQLSNVGTNTHAQIDAKLARTKLEGDIEVFYGPTRPTNAKNGDIWIPSGVIV
jgi:hypothetical protein